jgi:hypothetical protein
LASSVTVVLSFCEFHSTTVCATNPPPFTVIVVSPLPAGILLGDSEDNCAPVLP